MEFNKLANGNQMEFNKLAIISGHMLTQCSKYLILYLSIAWDVGLAEDISTCSNSSAVSRCWALRIGCKFGMFRYFRMSGAISSNALQSGSRNSISAALARTSRLKGVFSVEKNTRFTRKIGPNNGSVHCTRYLRL